MEVHRGEVFYADLSPVVGSEQGGVRPVLIVQNEIGNRHSPTVIAAAITSRLDKARLPTHINIRAADTGLAKDSVVLLEQIRTLDKHRLRERAGQITAGGPETGGSGSGCQSRTHVLLSVCREVKSYTKQKDPGSFRAISALKGPGSYTIFFSRQSCGRNAYSSGMPALAQASRVAASQTLACTSPMWALPSSSMHRRLWPMPPPME